MVSVDELLASSLLQWCINDTYVTWVKSLTSHECFGWDTTNRYGTPTQQEMCRNKTDNINRSDGDWVELPPSFTARLGLTGPAVYLVWICGDQGQYPGHVWSPDFGCAGIVNGTQEQWLQSYF